MKLLSLVAAHALLAQRRRERDAQGRLVATVEDYRAIHGLLAPLVESELDGLSPRAATVYRALAKSASATLARREIAAELGWSYNTTKRALAELQACELVTIADFGVPRRYGLADASLLGSAVALTPPNEL